MGGKGFLFFISLLLIASLLMVYWFIPFQETYFVPGDTDTNFSTSFSNESEMQFYPNLRFISPDISYRIENCPLNKRGEMEEAFEIIENRTILNFYPSPDESEITITCQSTNKFQGDLFIAGEGGPIRIVSSGNYNVIYQGAILSIRDSQCETPNVAIHELLHVLGFEHSPNPYNIMYNISRCGQEIGEDTLKKIDELYSLSPYPDLYFEDVSVFMNGRYINANFTVKNVGLGNAEASKVVIYADDKMVEKIDIEALSVGTGMKITLQNLFVNKMNIREISFLIEYPLGELEKNNNQATLKIKS